MTSKGRALDLDETRVQATQGEPLGLERWLTRKLLGAMGDSPIAITLWNGETIKTIPGSAEVTLRIQDRRALWGLVTKPDLYFGDAYSLGRIGVEGSLLRLVDLAGDASENYSVMNNGVGRLLAKLVTRAPRANTLAGSKENIHHHYDLSNDFYQLWLDPEHLQYTCAYYPHAGTTLDEAQAAKLHHVCRKLRLQPGDTVIEAGCGWGGLARFMALEYGAKVKAYNISHQQIMFASERAKREGFQDQVQYIEDDYRNARGDCDVFVSVGMLEHVGTRQYPVLGGVIDGCLKDNGRGLIHSIGRNQPRLMNVWIEKRIFPGAYPPTLGEMAAIFEPYQFSILDVENLRLHYARTLEHWLQNFENQRDKVADLFDEVFVRAWRLYLTGSISAFQRGDLQLFQVVFNRGQDNHVPLTREHLYS